MMSNHNLFISKANENYKKIQIISNFFTKKVLYLLMFEAKK